MDHPVAFRADLLRWYGESAADLPWRRARDAYRVWLSEIMLQQTQVTTVVPYFERFIAALPTVRDVAAAPLDQVLKLWEGLGYYSRARNLHRAAQMVVTDYGGEFPTTAGVLQRLPGIGRYTAHAIASICHDEAVAVLDGNVMRVLARLHDLPDDITRTQTQHQLWSWATALLPPDAPGDHNQAMMELGRMICRPRQPMCLICPVQRHCAAFAAGTQTQRPVKAARAQTPHYDVTAGVIRNASGLILIAQRPADGLLGGLWEFPGGKLEAGETLEACLKRELREELAIEVDVLEPITTVRHAFTHFRITLHAFDCRHRGGEPQALGCAAWQWVTLDELSRFAFGRADQRVIEHLNQRAKSGS
jgi:A/G-specific adenine glycosylase